ncbi:MAG: isoprenylcysteine carboxylmethyltransferase family protein [Candidatus Nanohaloarchaea archaeon]
MEWRRYRKYVLGSLAVVSVIGLPFFLQHFWSFISGQASSIIIRNRWDIAFLNIAGFLLFLIPLSFRRKVDWSSLGIYTAFIVSLFIEMYGIPLSVYLTSSFSGAAAYTPNYILSFSVLGQTFGMNFWMLLGVLITVIGMFLVAWGWITIYRTEDELVTSGIYSFSRHPQYLGIMLIASGWFIGWPTLLTTVILPILIYKYYKLCFKEEKEVMEEIGEEKYRSYRESTPMLL